MFWFKTRGFVATESVWGRPDDSLKTSKDLKITDVEMQTPTQPTDDMKLNSAYKHKHINNNLDWTATTNYSDQAGK